MKTAKCKKEMRVGEAIKLLKQFKDDEAIKFVLIDTGTNETKKAVGVQLNDFGGEPTLIIMEKAQRPKTTTIITSGA